MQVRTSTGHIFGGFTAVSWRRGDLVTKPPRWVPSCVADPEAFVFMKVSDNGANIKAAWCDEDGER